MKSVRSKGPLVYYASRHNIWFRLSGWGLAWSNNEKSDHVLFSTRWRHRPGIHIGPAVKKYPGDGRVAPAGKPVRRWTLTLLVP